MNRYKLTSVFFVILGLLVIIGSSYVIASYVSNILTGIVDFVTTNDYSKLPQCGITLPDRFYKIKSDLTTVILPFMYAGFPVLLIIISILMFLAGSHHRMGKIENGMKGSTNERMKPQKKQKQVMEETEEEDEQKDNEGEDNEHENEQDEVEDKKPMRKRR